MTNEETCATCKEFSEKFSLCFCPFNRTALDSYLAVGKSTKACFHYRSNQIKENQS